MKYKTIYSVMIIFLMTLLVGSGISFLKINYKKDYANVKINNKNIKYNTYYAKLFLYPQWKNYNHSNFTNNKNNKGKPKSNWYKYGVAINCPRPTSCIKNNKRFLLCRKRLINNISKKFSISKKDTQHIVSSAYKLSHINKVDPILVLSMIATESSFNKEANNDYGAMGLMQTVPRWHKKRMKALSITNADLLKVKPNINLGIHIFQLYLDKSHGNTIMALQRYNGSYDDKSKKYSKKVMDYYQWLYLI